jgi:hypothetical protein
MSIRDLISPLAVAAILTFSGGAMAQVMIDDFPVPEDEIGAFTQKCQALQASLNRSLTETDDDADATDDTTTGSIGAANPDPAALENEQGVLASLTVEQCEAAGLL